MRKLRPTALPRVRRAPRRRRGGTACVVASLLLAASALPASAEPPPAPEAAVSPDAEDIAIFGDVPLSGLRFIGTHNSYHQRPRLFGIPFLPLAFSKKHRYEHPPLSAQLAGFEGSAGAVRQLELDVHMRRFDDALRVLHVPWIDNQSSCKTLGACLRTIMAWSSSLDGEHAPVLVWIEPKDDTPIDRWLSLGFYERVDLLRVEEKIAGIVPRERIFTPDDLRGEASTLPEALTTRGWPTLSALRGKLIFALLDEGAHRDRYVALGDTPNLVGRLMFVKSSDPGEPFAALFKVNNAVPTLEDMEAFGSEALADEELAALQVYPEPPETDSRFVAWWKNLWLPVEAGDGPAAETDASAKPSGPDAPDTGSRGPRQPVVDDEAGDTEQLAGKDTRSASKLESREVDWRLRRELESVYVDTSAEARRRHLEEVAALEERMRAEYVLDSDDLAVVLENARRSRAYRNLLRERLRDFIGDSRRAMILGLVRAGFIVTTTADEPQRSAASNRKRAASSLLSGAQYVSTDALTPSPMTGYVLEVPDARIRCNVLVDPDGCAAATAEAR